MRRKAKTMETKALLKTIADEYAPSLGELDVHVSERSFEKGSYFAKVAVREEDPFKAARDTVIDMGTVLSEDREHGIVVAMLGGGIAGKTPVIFVAVVVESEISLGAYSKEGLIRQKAAKRAVESFIALLNRDA